MNLYNVKVRIHGGIINRVKDVTISAISEDEVISIVDHWNENSDEYFHEIISIKEDK